MRMTSCLLTALLFSQYLLADNEAEIKYRESVMQSVGGHMGAMGTIVKQGVHFEAFKFHADAMADLADIVPNVFPAGSGKGKTEAKAEIWESPEQFNTALDKFVTAARGMSEVSNSRDMRVIVPAIKSLAGSCKGCHDDFRED